MQKKRKTLFKTCVGCQDYHNMGERWGSNLNIKRLVGIYN